MRRGQMFRLWLAVYCAHTIAGCSGATAEQTVHQRLSTLVDEAERVSQQMPAQISLAFYGDRALVGARDAKRKAMLDEKVWSSHGHRTLWVDAQRDEAGPVPIAEILPQLTEDQRASIERILYFRYVGPTESQGGHISSVFGLADFSVSGYQWVVDLSTRRVFSAQEFKLWVKDRDRLLSEQVVPDVEKGRGNTLTFFTRGMVKFAQPDLEMGVARDSQAKTRFNTFQNLIAQILAGPPMKIGQSIGGYELTTCRRASVSYEKGCVRLDSKRAN